MLTLIFSVFWVGHMEDLRFAARFTTFEPMLLFSGHDNVYVCVSHLIAPLMKEEVGDRKIQTLPIHM